LPNHMAKMMKLNYKAFSEDEILDMLLEKYKNDADAQDFINRTKEELPYLRQKKDEQYVRQHILQLVAHLETWHN